LILVLPVQCEWVKTDAGWRREEWPEAKKRFVEQVRRELPSARLGRQRVRRMTSETYRWIDVEVDEAEWEAYDAQLEDDLDSDS
jgi:hypothetical protein